MHESESSKAVDFEVRVRIDLAQQDTGLKATEEPLYIVNVTPIYKYNKCSYGSWYRVSLGPIDSGIEPETDSLIFQFYSSPIALLTGHCVAT